MRKEFEMSKELKKRFYVSIALTIFLGLFLLTYGFYLIFFQSSLTRGIPFLLIALWLLFWTGLTAFIVNATRLVLSQEQIEFYSPGLQLVTSWDNLERIGTSSNHEVLILRTPAMHETAWWFRLFLKIPERQIPLSLFSNWRSSEIGQEIKKYAAHLFTDDRAFK